MQCKGAAVSSSSHDGSKDADGELGSLRDGGYGTHAREKAEGRGSVAPGELAGADGGAGERRSKRGGEADLRRPMAKATTMAMKRSPPACFLRRGDVVLDSGDAGHGGAAKGGRWPRG